MCARCHTVMFIYLSAQVFREGLTMRDFVTMAGQLADMTGQGAEGDFETCQTVIFLQSCEGFPAGGKAYFESMKL